MRAEELMSVPVLTVRPGTAVREAVAIMASNRVTSLPVLDPDGSVIGMLSEVDALRHRVTADPRVHQRGVPVEGEAPGDLVQDVMTDIVVCLSPQADAADVAQVLIDNRIRAVPIIDGSTLVGIVSRRDLLRTLLRDDTAIAADIQERVDAYAGATDQWRVGVREGVVTIAGPLDCDRTRKALDALARTVPGVVHVTVDDDGTALPSRDSVRTRVL